ncbi:MAG: hypothetical protein ACOYOB_18995 [Myxococcota bacterium]
MGWSNATTGSAKVASLFAKGRVVALLVAVVVGMLACPELEARSRRKQQKLTIAGAFMYVPRQTRILSQEEPDYGEILYRTVLPTVPSPRDLALDLVHHTRRLREYCAASPTPGCTAAQAAETGQPRAWAEQLVTLAGEATAGKHRSALRRLAVAVRVDLSDLAIARDLAAENAAGVRGRDRLDALWQLQAVLERMGDRAGRLRVLRDLTRAANGKAVAVDWACATEALAEALEQVGDTRAAVTWRKLLKRFEQLRLPKDGGPAARAAAHAQYALLLPGHEALRNAPWPDVSTGTGIEKARRLERTARTWMDDVFGPEHHSKTEDWRSGGRHEQWLDLARFGAKEWAYRGHFRSAELLVEFTRKIYGAPYIEGMIGEEEAYGSPPDLYGKPVEDRALHILLAIHQDADRLSLSFPVLTDVRRMLNRYKPKEFPLLKDVPLETRDTPPAPAPTPP